MILTKQVTPYNEQFRQLQRQAESFFLSNGADPVTAGNRAMALAYQLVQQEASLLSFMEAFLVMAFLFLTCTALILFMPKAKHQDSHEAVVE